MTTTTPDLLALVRATRAHPDEHDIRLRLADWYDEQPTRRVVCPKCEGKKWVKSGYVRCDVRGIHDNTRKDPCLNCWVDDGPTGEVPDTEYADRSEYLRLGVELERAAPCSWVGAGGPSCERWIVNGEKGRCTACHATRALTARRRDLAAALAPAWTCPGCDGGMVRYEPPIGPQTCPTCGGSGDLWKRPESGFLELIPQPLPIELDHAGYPQWVTVPTLGELIAGECRSCGARDSGVWCQCGEPLWPTPTPRLRALATLPPWGVPLDGVCVGDREPLTGDTLRGKVVSGGVWYSDRSDTGEARHTLPHAVFSLLEGGEEFTDTFAIGADVIRVHPTPDLARRALGRGILKFGRS